MKFRRKHKPKCGQHEMCSKSTFTLRISKSHGFTPTISSLGFNYKILQPFSHCLNICPSCEPVRLTLLVVPLGFAATLLVQQ